MGARSWILVVFFLAALFVLTPSFANEVARNDGGPFWFDYEFWLVVFTFILAICTALLFWATRDLVKGAERTAKQELRAYLTLDSISFHPSLPEKPIKMVFSVVNTGLTPARNFTIRKNWHTVPRGQGLPEGFAYIDKPTVLAPGATYRESKSSIGRGQVPGNQKTLTDAERSDMMAAQRGDVDIFVYGTIEYEDIFQERHETKFCLVFDPNPAAMLSPFAYHTEHNHFT